MDGVTKYKILQLLDQPKYVTSKKIATELSLSQKTILKVVKDLDQEIRDYGAQLEILPRKGIKLIIMNRVAYREYFKSKLVKEPIPQNQLGRTNYIITRLLETNHPIPIDEFADELFVSHNTIQNDLKLIRNKIDPFNLKVKSIRSEGLIVSGLEIDKRRYLAKINELPFYEELLINNSSREILEKLETKLQEIFLKNQFKISDIGFRNLIIHLFIAIKRIQQNSFVTNLKQDFQFFSCEIQKIAYEISKMLENSFEISFPEQERFFISLHLDGKKVFDRNEPMDNSVISEEVFELVNKMLMIVDETYDKNFMTDFELRMNLSLHLIPLITRVKHQIYLDNPLIIDIKKKMSLSFLMSKTAVEILDKEFGSHIPDDEIGYIALHFNLSLERSKKGIPPKNIVVICGSGVGSAELVSYKLRENFDHYLGEIITIDSLGLPYVDFSDIDYAITTIDINVSLPVPLLKVSLFLDDLDLENINQFFKNNTQTDFSKLFKEELFFTELQSVTKNEILKEIVENISKVVNISSNFYDLVLEREKVGLTELESGVAIPHPIEAASSEPFIAVAIPKKPIKWNEYDISLIIILGLKKEHKHNLQQLYQSLSKFLLNKNAIDRVVDAKTLNSLIENLS
ncbi:BglG family transcription antiterminator [Streptococcus sp. ZJ151]|uniref:BglG family transcription antiterminator n=1 Tax=Streptococcus jiangjianxini TaxID=3161189 RepID=UPI0032F057A0